MLPGCRVCWIDGLLFSETLGLMLAAPALLALPETLPPEVLLSESVAVSSLAWQPSCNHSDMLRCNTSAPLGVRSWGLRASTRTSAVALMKASLVKAVAAMFGTDVMLIS